MTFVPGASLVQQEVHTHEPVNHLVARSPARWRERLLDALDVWQYRLTIALLLGIGAATAGVLIGGF